MKRMKFGDMPAGTHFNDGSRNFIKLVPVTACGIPQKHGRIVEKSEHGPESKFLPFNAVDYKGCAATCPDWLIFALGTI